METRRADLECHLEELTARAESLAAQPVPRRRT